MSHFSEQTPQGVDKVSRYNWGVVNSPGELKWLSKNILKVDHDYQRQPKNLKKINEIAKDWNWISVAAIVVARRADGSCWVVDGQHRVCAAKKRSDIDALPCIVHEVHEVEKEALAFLETNAGRKPVQSVDKHKAAILSGDPVSIEVQRLLDEGNKTLSGGGNTPNGIKCIRLMGKMVETSHEPFVKVWPLICELTEGQYCHERLIDALVYIEKRMPEGQSLTDARWRKRLVSIGSEDLLKAAGEGAAFFSKGGAKAWAMGMLNRINKGLRNGLEIES